MALTTLATIIDALPGQTVEFLRSGVNTFGGGVASYWTAAGLPTAGATPVSGVAGDVPTSATAGALVFTNPTSGLTSLARAMVGGAGTTVVGAFLLYDRLWQNSGIDATITTGQTIQSSTPPVPLTRPDALGANAEVWWHVYSVMGAGTPTVTLAYTDQDGNLAQAATSGALATTMAAGRTGQFTLAAGDTGVRSVQTWTANATFTSGTIGLVIRRLIAIIPMSSYPHPNYDNVLDVLACGMKTIPDSACLELLYVSSVTSALVPFGVLDLVQG